MLPNEVKKKSKAHLYNDCKFHSLNAILSLKYIDKSMQTHKVKSRNYKANFKNALIHFTTSLCTGNNTIVKSHAIS